MKQVLPDLLSMIGDLVAVPSVSSAQPALDTGNRAVCEKLANWAEDLGFCVELMPVPHREGKYNMIARLGEGGDGLVLAGHTDTVPWDEGRWSYDPFEATERDGRIYGLGTADMKSFLAIALHAAAAFRADRLTRPLTILGTADEESTMSGARALMDRSGSLGRYAVIGEPTDMRPVNLHKGIIMERIRLVGASGHSSNPALGRNALEGMLEVADALRELRAEFAAAHREPAFEVPEPTINLGYISGGDNANRICGECEMHIDVRLNPGMTTASVRDAIRGKVSERLDGSGLDVHIKPLFEGVDPLVADERDELVHACESISGHGRGAVCFGTEGPFLQALGIETVIMGPGSIDQAHQPDEYLTVSDARRAVGQVGGIIHRFCVDGDHGGS